MKRRSEVRQKLSQAGGADLVARLRRETQQDELREVELWLPVAGTWDESRIVKVSGGVID